MARALAWLLVVAGALVPAARGAPAEQGKPVEVRLDGLDGEMRNNALSALRIAQVAEDGRAVAAWRVERLHRAARDEIARALEPYGRYRPRIDARLEETPEGFRAIYDVDPGPPIEIARLTIDLEGPGRDDETLRQAAEDFPLEQGGTLSHAGYERGKRELRDRARDRGYFDARYVTHEIRLDLEAYRAEIALRLATGQRYRFGEVSFEQDFLIPELLSDYLPFRPGDPYEYNKLQELRRQLSGTSYFSAVEVRPRPERGEGRSVPVEVRLSPRPKRKWTLGAGFGTDTGPRGEASVEVRRFGRRGHRGRLETKVSQLRSAFEATYEIPGGGRGPRIVALNTGYRDENLDDGDAQTLSAGIELTRPRGGWRQSFGLAFDLDDFKLGVDRGRSKLLAPRIGFSRVRADDRIVPARGYRLTLQVRGATEELLSNSSYLQGRAAGKGVLTIGEGWRVLGRIEVGYTETSDFRDLPPSVRFFAGGDNSVRGYDFRDLGRRDAKGSVIGGEALVVGSMELERRIYGRWGMAVFLDAGNAMRTLAGALEAGAGLGLRVRTPIGMIRGDLAWAISQPDSPIRFHFTVGPDL